MPQLVLLRHGESQWSSENKFAGWTDVPLTAQGIEEAREAGRVLKQKGYRFDVVFTSILRRAIRTTWEALDTSDNYCMPIVNSWRLNDRHYGALQGMNKAECVAKYGQKQVSEWRLSFQGRPPALAKGDKRHPSSDALYAGVPPSCLPESESLAMVLERVLPFWHDQVSPIVEAGHIPLIVGHEHSLRALIKHVEGISDQAIGDLSLPPGCPIVIELDDAMNFVSRKFLMAPLVVAAKEAAYAASIRRLPSMPPCVVPLKAKTGVCWAELITHAQAMKAVHLRALLADEARNDSMFVSAEGIVLDYTRQKANKETMQLLFNLAKAAGVEDKRTAMFSGDKINETEDRSVLHVALRAPRGSTINSDGKNVVPDVWKVLDGIKGFSDKVRSGEWKGHTGKALTDVVCIGIGGSYLGVEFVFEALKTDPKASQKAAGRRMRFLANVDPIDVRRALAGLNAETTLVVVISKTFTTAETMLNAKTVKEWIIKELGTDQAVAKHVVACSTALDKTKAFGIDSANVFGFWDWVGGRFSVWSAVGALPLALQYGFGVFEEFCTGARSMDEHFRSAAPESNLPMLVGLLSLWNASCLGYEGCAVLPYCQALVRFVAHIQQLDMESNGKRVRMDGTECDTATGALYFGEPGTNGQHSFYQLMHQGRAIPAEFIGYKKSQHPVSIAGEPVSNHDELMSNFFAQPDALALGKTEDELRAEGVPDSLIPHKAFPGDRPSLSLLIDVCNAKTLGQLLSLYEHRTSVQGWVWGINSFDQWGVQLGKMLATAIRGHLGKSRKGQPSGVDMPAPTAALLEKYLS
eukprot:TRINITY_DN6718_c0_g2_i1.p1 TRINITY_DN6718_c0_g2~~TRINITY_DN6718_c0_g2_i1.p1  ORF type:complete len:807 (-),score=203.55 TRINITY_DN6718_c0_g2_i1:100-2520(-)